jgi:hypothetical protein
LLLLLTLLALRLPLRVASRLACASFNAFFLAVILTLSKVEWGRNPRILHLPLSVLFSSYQKSCAQGNGPAAHHSKAVKPQTIETPAPIHNNRLSYEFQPNIYTRDRG